MRRWERGGVIDRLTDYRDYSSTVSQRWSLEQYLHR